MARYLSASASRLSETTSGCSRPSGPFVMANSCPPDCFLGPAKLHDLSFEHWCFSNREELVALRRLHACATQHAVRLTAVMDVMLEQVQQQSVGALGLHACAAMHTNDPIRPVLVQ